jgi:hypothetical protein
MKWLRLSAIALAVLGGRGVRADTPASTDQAGAARLVEPAATGVRRALIICGHPGDDEHRTLFAETVEQLQGALVERYEFDAESVWVLFGGEEPAPADPGIESPRGPSTAEGIAQTVSELRSTIRPDDVLWVIAMGHANYDRRHSWYNLPGTDLHEETFAALFNDLTCREQIFWITMPASGYYIKPLSAPDRIIISATEADRELNETNFPHVMADVLAADSPVDAAAADTSSSQTLLELYLAITRRVAEQFAGDMQVATEHAQLEANGDGKGTEIQFQHLPEELGGRLKEGETPPEPLPNSDEAAAIAVVIPRAPPAAVTPEAEAPAADGEPAAEPAGDTPPDERTPDAEPESGTPPAGGEPAAEPGP